MKNEKKKGITLVELMVVVAIIGVLALLGLKTYSTQQERAIKAITKANLGTIQLMLREREVAGIVSLMNPKQYENKKSSWGLEYLWDQNICELNLAFNWEKYDIQISPVEYFFIINTINSKKTWCLAIGTFVDEIHPNMLMRVSQKIAQSLEYSEEVEFIPVKIESVDKSILEMIRESSDLYTLYKKP